MSTPQAPAGPAQAAPQAAAPAGPPGAGPAPDAGPGAQASPEPGHADPKAPGSAQASGNQSGEDQASPSKPTLNEPGQGAARQEALRKAQHVIDGDVVGRDKFVFLLGGEKKAAIRRLSPLLKEPVRHAFVDPDGWDELRERFGKHRIVILRGTPGHGRTAMAVRLLMSTSTEVMYDLDPQVDLNLLAEQLKQDQDGSVAVERGAGFLLRQPGQLAALHGRTLRGFDDALTDIEARLVLTVGPEVRLADEELIEYLVELPSAPSYRQIVEQHLEWRLGGERAAQELLARENMPAGLEDLLDDVTSCEEAARLALLVSEEAGDTINLARVRERMARRSLDAFDIWFEDLRDVDLRSFAIALAALDGLPYEDVARAAEMLRRRLDPPVQVVMAAPDSGQPVGRDRFRMPRRQKLELLRATVVDTEFRRPYGWVPSEAVAYKDRSYPRAVLSRAWHGYQIHDVVLDWLSELAEEPSEQVLAQVGTTLGVLSTFSFHHLLTAVLLKWAGSEELYKREAVAYALRVPAADEQLRGSVTHLVNLWFGSVHDPALQATAARVHGVGLADADPEASLAALDRLARDADYKVDVAIGYSFIDLLLSDAARFAPTVLRTLLRWFDSPERADTARLIFLMVANDLVTDRTVGGSGAASVTWPTLLHLAHDSPGLRDLLILTWCRVLNEGSYLDLAEGVIDGWARQAEGAGELLEAFARMVRAVGATDPRAREIIRRSAARWLSDDNLFPLPKAAHAVEAVLAGR
ncbi:MAG: hypothetical protein ACRDTH_27330 [Pseudonocardiaceae bacterium]